MGSMPGRRHVWNACASRPCQQPAGMHSVWSCFLMVLVP